MQYNAGRKVNRFFSCANICTAEMTYLQDYRFITHFFLSHTTHNAAQILPQKPSYLFRWASFLYVGYEYSRTKFCVFSLQNHDAQTMRTLKSKYDVRYSTRIVNRYYLTSCGETLH